MYTYIPCLLNLSPNPQPSQPLGHRSAKLSSLCYRAGSHQLSIQVCLFKSMKAKQALTSKNRLIQLWFIHLGYEYIMSQRNIY